MRGNHAVVRCARCGVKHHEPCFWRVLPLEEWVEYVQWAMETSEEENDEEHEDGFEIICGVCREKKRSNGNLTLRAR